MQTVSTHIHHWLPVSPDSGFILCHIRMRCIECRIERVACLVFRSDETDSGLAISCQLKHKAS